MLNNDARALDAQHKRILSYLHIAGQPCLRRQFVADWREAATDDARLAVIDRWCQSLIDAEIMLFAGGDDAA